MLKSAKDLILRLRAEDESSHGLAAAMEEVSIQIFIFFSLSFHCVFIILSAPIKGLEAVMEEVHYYLVIIIPIITKFA